MSKFKVGEKVACYGGGVRTVCTVKKILKDGTVSVVPRNSIHEIPAHPKQLRKLKKKASQYYYLVDEGDGMPVGFSEKEEAELYAIRDSSSKVIKVKVVKDNE